MFDYIQSEIIPNSEIVLLSDLLCHLCKEIKELGADKSLDNTKKHIRRKLEAELCSSVQMFPNRKGKLIFLPASTSLQKLAEENLELRKELKSYRDNSNNAAKIVQDAAMNIRAELKSVKSNLSWPPQPSDLKMAANVPPLVKQLLTIIINGNIEDVSCQSESLTPRVYSFAQDLIYAFSDERCLTRKHILLPFAVKSLTGNVELIRILNCLGHGVSYTRTLEIDTAFAPEEMAIHSL